MKRSVPIISLIISVCYVLPANATGWMYYGQCFAVMESARQHSDTHSEKKMYTDAVRRAQRAFIRASFDANKPIDTSSQSAFYEDMKNYLVYFSDYLSSQPKQIITKVIDSCFKEFIAR